MVLESYVPIYQKKVSLMLLHLLTSHIVHLAHVTQST